MFHNFKLEIKLFLIVAVVSVLIATAGIFLLVFLGSPITPSEPGLSTTQEAGEFNATENVTRIDVSSVDATNWRTFAPYAKITIKTPRDWYPETYPEEPNAVTYGSGIASFLTIRYFEDPTTEEQRINRFIEEGRSVTKEMVHIETKEFTRHTIGAKCVSDVCDFGFRDWYVVFGNDVFIFSENATSEEEKVAIAAVIGSVAKFPGTFGDNNVDVSTWQTYRNDEFGFEVKYPNNYSIKTSGERREGGVIYVLSAVDIYRETEASLVTVNVTGPNFVLGTRDWEDFSLGGIEGSVAYNWEDWKVREKVSSAEIIFTSKNNQSFFLTTRGDPFEDKTINQILSTFRFVDRDITSGILLTPEDVLSSPGMYGREEIEVHGIIELIPFVDSFGLGGASPGFKTAIGNITVSNWDYVWDAAQNRSEVLVRGVFDASSNFISFPNGCAECFRNISPQP